MSPSPSFDYQKDLAYIHHAGFSSFVRQAAPEVIRLLRDSRVPGGLVVDLGCGGGILARELLRAGYDVLGVDSSPAMIELARETAPKARFVTASLYDFTPPPCDAVTALGEVFNYLPPGARRPPNLAAVFRKIGEALRLGGVLLFDVLIHSAGNPIVYRTWSEGDDWVALVDVSEDKARHRLRRDITTFRQVGKLYRRGHETHQAHIYWRYQIERDLERAGFELQYGQHYGDFALPPRRLVFHARKVQKKTVGPPFRRERLGRG